MGRAVSVGAAAAAAAAQFPGHHHHHHRIPHQGHRHHRHPAGAAPPASRQVARPFEYPPVMRRKHDAEVGIFKLLDALK